MKQIREIDYVQAWLLFFLVTTLGGSIVGLLLGSFLAAFLGAGGMPLAEMTRLLQIAGFVIAIPISYITFRVVIGKFLLPKLEED